jgi:hypothetical protein
MAGSHPVAPLTSVGVTPSTSEAFVARARPVLAKGQARVQQLSGVKPYGRRSSQTHALRRFHELSRSITSLPGPKTPLPLFVRGGAHVAALLCPAHLGLMRSISSEFDIRILTTIYIDDILCK